MLNNEVQCVDECAKLDELYKKYRKNTMFTSLSRKRVTIIEDKQQVDLLCIAPTIQDKNMYRVLYLDGTGATAIKNMNMSPYMAPVQRM